LARHLRFSSFFSVTGFPVFRVACVFRGFPGLCLFLVRFFEFFAYSPSPRMKVAWISHFAVEWLPDAPEAVRNLPRGHPATWQMVLLDELVQGSRFKVQSLGEKVRSPESGVRSPELHIISVRKHFERSFSFEWRGVTFHCLKVPGGMRTATLFWWETLLIRRCLARIKPDLVHAWGSERGAALVASRLKYPYLVTMQGLLEWYAERVRLSRYQRLEAKLERPSLRRASVVTTESTFGVKWLRDHYPHLEVRQAEHAANWLFHKLERRPKTKPLHFLYVAMMSRLKGTDILLQALDRLTEEFDFRLTLVGSGKPGFVSELKAQTSGSLWQRVTMKNNLRQSEVAEEMAQATMVLFPTRADTSPNSVKEAVVAGVPVVASAVGGITDYVVSGLNGFTVPPDDVKKFTGAVREAVVHPLFSRGEVDPGTLARMRDYLSPKVMAEKFLASYERVLEKAEEK
jgi:glycosyltransferase involved in cell wall biosynthesis